MPDYNGAHRALRARVAPLVAAGEAVCVRCGGRIIPGTAWDLGHAPDGSWAGPEHASCNRAAGAAQTNALRHARSGPPPVDARRVLVDRAPEGYPWITSRDW